MNKQIDIQGVKQLLEEKELWIVDTRNKTSFIDGFIPGALFLPLDGFFAQLAQALVPRTGKLLVVAEAGTSDGVEKQLNIAGLTPAGIWEADIDEWINSGGAIDLVIDVEPDELIMDLPFDENLVVVDVRDEDAFTEAHLENAESLPIGELTDIVNLASFEEKQNLYVYSQSGLRSLTAISLFKRQGLHNVRNVNGGWEQLRQEGRAKIVGRSKG